MSATRVDRWLWAVRLCKTRTEATDACKGGKVKVGGQAVKPSTQVGPGIVIEAHLHGRERVVEVTRVIEKRVGAAIAQGCYIDRSPEPPAWEPPIAPRDRGAGRPTKRDRRQLDRWRAAEG